MNLTGIIMQDESQVEEVLTRGQRGYKFTNWSTTFSCSPELFFEPETTDDIREVGSRFSFLIVLTYGCIEGGNRGKMRL